MIKKLLIYSLLILLISLSLLLSSCQKQTYFKPIVYKPSTNQSISTNQTICAGTNCFNEQESSDNSSNLACDNCQDLENDFCEGYECCSDDDCPSSQVCYDHDCVDLACSCGYVEDHICYNYECCSNSDCGVDGVCENPGTVNARCVHYKPDLGQKIAVIQSGEPDQKIDLLFIPQRIKNISILPEKIKDILYGKEEEKGLFKIEPFSYYKNKFNVFYLDKNIDENYFGCYFEKRDPSLPPSWHVARGCDFERIKKEYSIYEPDYIILLFDIDEKYRSYGGEVQGLNINAKNYIWTFVHEFGHQFGGLADEYIFTNSPSFHCGSQPPEMAEKCFENYVESIKVVPNIDTLGCPKWCESYDLNKLLEEQEICTSITNQEECENLNGGGICTWFVAEHPFLNAHCVLTSGLVNIGINCEEDTECVFGADYGQLAFNPGSSIMGGGITFNKPSKDHLKMILECCYPRKETPECKQFRDKLSHVPEQTNPNYKIAYNKIANCK